MKHAVEFDVRVLPRSSRSEIVGMHDGALKIKLKSPPVDGAANDELVRLLSKILGTSRSNVKIVSGAASRNKRVRVTGLPENSVREVLLDKC